MVKKGWSIRTIHTIKTKKYIKSENNRVKSRAKVKELQNMGIAVFVHCKNAKNDFICKLAFL